MIEVFRDFEISGPQDKLTTFLSQFARALPLGWARDAIREKELRNRTSKNERTFAFKINATDTRPAAHVFLVRHGDTIRVTNVVPVNYGQLSRAEYNSFIDDLSATALPIAQRLGLKPTVTAAHQDIRDLLSIEAFKALSGFSGFANKSTGSTHPSDRQRWVTFLVLQHADHRRLDTDILVRWLIEEEKWPETEAHDLGSEFEFARELLAAYDAVRG